MQKICNKCGIEKDISCFYKRDNIKYRNECKECLSLHKKEKYNENKNDENYMNKRRDQSINFKKNNKDKISKLGKDYYLKNKDEIDKKHREYYHKNKNERCQKITKYRNSNKDKVKKWAENRRKDPLKRLIYNIRTLIGNSLREKGYSKKSRTEQILGCSFIDFKNHIESQFLENMNWLNRHSYKPVSK